MANTPDFIAHLLDLLGHLGHVQIRPMFGGHGVYLDRLFVAVVLDDVLYLKSDGETVQRFVARGLEPFRYERGTRAAAMGFHRAPAEALEDLGSMREWAGLARAAAQRAAAAPRTAGAPGPRVDRGESQPHQPIITRRTRGPGTRVTGRARPPGPRGSGSKG